MSSNGEDLGQILRKAEEEIDVKSSNLGLLRNEYMMNLDTLQSQYHPKMAPIASVVFVCKQEQQLLELKIQWQEKKLVVMEQRKNKFMEAVDMAPHKKELTDALQPQLEDAFQSMEHVTREELDVLRGYEHPPDLVLKTIQMVMQLRGEDDRSWTAAKVMLSETYYYSFFVYKARSRTRQPVEGDVMEALEAYCADPETTVESVYLISRPCGAMTKWLRALRDLARIESVSAVRRQTAEQARDELKELQAELQRKREDGVVAEKRYEELQQELKTKIAELRERYDETMLPLQELFFDANQNFNSIYRSPARRRQEVQTDDIDNENNLEDVKALE